LIVWLEVREAVATEKVRAEDDETPGDLEVVALLQVLCRLVWGFEAGERRLDREPWGVLRSNKA
jgi:hypothetical protein